MERLRRARVAVIGLGGVGSWAAEALARSGLGRLDLVDLDDVCVSNVNRQLPALDGAIGVPKAQVLAERFRAIHPAGCFNPVIEFFTADNANRILGLEAAPPERPDFVIDAIDSTTHKCLLAALCLRHGIPIIISGAAGGRCDPTRLAVRDLAEATHDRLLREVRHRLRREHDLPRKGPMGLRCVISTEPPVAPAVCDAEEGTGARLNCDWGYGSATFVTGAMGFAAAAQAVAILARA